jgi:hypothetical protein
MPEATVPQNLLDRRALRPHVDSVPFMEVQIPEEEIIVMVARARSNWSESIGRRSIMLRSCRSDTPSIPEPKINA